MPTTKQQDFLMTQRFHVLDVSVTIPPILIPTYGFSSCNAPELNIEYKEINEGNFEYPRKVFQRASVNNLTLARGVRLQDTDFYTWATNYVEGKREKKNLMLVQFTDISPFAENVEGLPSAVEYSFRLPGRAWVLRNCSPGRYKVASDFDASQGQISIHELDIAYEFFIEFNTGIV